MAVWDDVLGDTDRAVFEAAGWGRRAGFGERPAIMVIDVNYNFCGDRAEPILESIKRWRYSCGEVAWTTGIPAIARILEAARRKRLPIIYTTNPRREDGFDLGIWSLKSHRAEDDVDVIGHRGNDIVDEVAPLPGDLFIEKRKPSAFFGTPLMSHITNLARRLADRHRVDHQRVRPRHRGRRLVLRRAGDHPPRGHLRPVGAVPQGGADGPPHEVRRRHRHR